MSLRNMEVQYVGDTLYLPPLEREVKHIVVREADAADWMRYEPIVRCRDCKRFDKETEKWCRFEHETAGVQWRTAEPDGFCKWGVRE